MLNDGNRGKNADDEDDPCCENANKNVALRSVPQDNCGGK